MTAEERFQFDQIRDITEGPLYEGNTRIFDAIENCPDVLEAIDGMKELRQHYLFCLNKFDKVFVNTPRMCLLYTGVEDGVPFPAVLRKILSVGWEDDSRTFGCWKGGRP